MSTVKIKSYCSCSTSTLMEQRMQNLRLSHHPLNAELKKLGIPRTAVAAYLGRSYSSVSGWLLGYVPMPSDIHFKIVGFIRQVRDEKGGLQ
jgi:hypothetical protein